MVTRIVKWVSLTALVLMVASWRPFPSYQLPLSFVICAGAVMVVLTLFSIKRRIETHVDNRSNLGKQVPVKAESVPDLSATANAETRRRL